MGCDIHQYFEIRKQIANPERLGFVESLAAGKDCRLQFADWLEDVPDRCTAEYLDWVRSLPLPRLIVGAERWEYVDWRTELDAEEEKQPAEDRCGFWEKYIHAHPLYGERYYRAFARLAGVRNYNDHKVKFPPRGVPWDMSPAVFAEYIMRVLPEGAEERPEGERGVCTRAEAEGWAEPDYRASEWIDDGKNFIAHPDWHTPSWLTLRELEQVDWSGMTDSKLARTTIPYLRTLGGPDDVRMVFWFDN